MTERSPTTAPAAQPTDDDRLAVGLVCSTRERDEAVPLLAQLIAEARAAGYTAGLEDARASGYASGYAEGRRAVLERPLDQYGTTVGERLGFRS